MDADKKRDLAVADALTMAARILKGAGIEGAEREAEWILCHILGMKRHELFMNIKKPLSEAEQARLEEILARRKIREPLAYIIDEAPFRGLVIRVTRDVLIPRPETELLVDEALTVLKGLKKPLVLDLCTGSGCIAVSLAVELAEEKFFIYATDVSEAALGVATENARRYGVNEKIKFLKGDLFGSIEGMGLEGRFDLIVSNPPYVAEAEIQGLEPEIRDFEPGLALSGGRGGTEVIERIISASPGYLRPGGVLIVEIDPPVAGAVRELAEKTHNYSDVMIKRDLQGLERIFIARRG